MLLQSKAMKSSWLMTGQAAERLQTWNLHTWAEQEIKSPIGEWVSECLSDDPPATCFNRPIPIAFCPSSTNANQRQYLFLIKSWLWHFWCRGVWWSLCIASTNANDQEPKLKHDSASFENVDDFSIWSNMISNMISHAFICIHMHSYAFICMVSVLKEHQRTWDAFAHPKGTAQIVPTGPELARPITQRWLFPGVESEGRQPTGPQEL